MIFKILRLALFLASCSIMAVAELPSRRRLSSDKVTLCYSTSATTYKTIKVSTQAAWVYYSFYKAVKGKCSNKKLCGDLCQAYPSFQVAESACTCVVDDPVTPLLCGANANLTSDAASCRCLPGFEGDALLGCSDVDECKSVSTSLCAANQVCANKIGSYACNPLKCANPYGNPCGPGSACTDNDSGFTCAPINQNGCPVGCGPNSTCVNGGVSTGFTCECNGGFYRPQPYLPCVAVNATATTCGTNAVKAANGACQCVSGYEGNATKGCTDIDECIAQAATTAVPVCAGNQKCNNTMGSYKCEPLTCDVGAAGGGVAFNPCGPGRACANSATGYTCTAVYDAAAVCPAGCGPNSACVTAGNTTTTTGSTTNSSSSGSAYCKCNTGFYRPQPSYPCKAVAVP